MTKICVRICKALAVAAVGTFALGSHGEQPAAAPTSITNAANQSSPAGTAGQSAPVRKAPPSDADVLLDLFQRKGLISEQDVKDAREALDARTNTPTAPISSPWKISDAIKSIQLFGDLRFRYEYRGADNAPGSGQSGDTYMRERLRYALRLGVRGDLFDDFYYGLRLETSSNPRSPWVTFGDDTNPTPFAKNSDTIAVGQAYLGWRASDWLELTVGKMPMPLYVTPLIWDSDINPEGLAEKVKYSVGRADLFATSAQFVYQNSNPGWGIPTSDTFLLAFQGGANVNVYKDMFFKMAPVIYIYSGHGEFNGLNQWFSGQGFRGINLNTVGYNQNGINDLLVLEVPAEFNFKLGGRQARIFGDFAYNFEGNGRAENAAVATAPGGDLPYPVTGQNFAYQVGLAYGNLGMVYGQASKRGTWEARVYWQHIEQYAVDVNLIDSDFFEGRANLQGIYTAFAYSITDGIIATARYGYANQINDRLGTGGNNPDLPVLNPIKNYNLVQLDLTWRF